MKFSIEDSIGLVKEQTIALNDSFTLECGSVLEDIQIRFETYGTLNEDKSNAIYICHALSGNHHAAGYHTIHPKPDFGWWEVAIGPNKSIDTNQYYVVCANNLGGCHGTTGPRTINKKTGQEYGEEFPFVTVLDWVNMQKKLMISLGISKWFAVIGGSLGGMQALQWSISYPDLLHHCVLIASSAELSTQNIAFNEVARSAIRWDPNFHNGLYLQNGTIPDKGLAIARMLGHLTYISSESLADKFGRELIDNESHYNINKNQFEIERYLHYQGNKFVKDFDAHTYLRNSKALDYYDPSTKFAGSLAKALAHVLSNFFICSFTSDWRFPPAHSEKIVQALVQNKKSVSYASIPSTIGHDDFLVDNQPFLELLKTYLTPSRYA
ncbi:MAG: homoserine O-acetyltransferase [Methylacidiphilales bacterium]|nr:homoserine O-acetyltransferase [Candidatus Methylacidiphilales bacterium]